MKEKIVLVNDGRMIHKQNNFQLIQQFLDEIENDDEMILIRLLTIYKTKETLDICITEVLLHYDERGWS